MSCLHSLYRILCMQCTFKARARLTKSDFSATQRPASVQNLTKPKIDTLNIELNSLGYTYKLAIWYQWYWCGCDYFMECTINLYEKMSGTK